jgi:transposase
MLNNEERVAIVTARLHGLSYQQVQQSFERQFRKPAPTRANIRLLVNKFKRTGSVLDEKRSGRPQISEDDAGRILQATEQSPHASIRRLSNQLDIPRTTVWRV